MSKLSLICLSLLLCGCQSKAPEIVYKTKTEKIVPSEALLQPCKRTVAIPELKVEDIYTNKDAFERGEGKCADAFDKVIKWYKEDGSNDR